MSRFSRLTSVIAGLAVAGLVASACGASTENPQEGASSQTSVESSSEAPAESSASTEAPAESSSEAPAESSSEAEGTDSGEPEPLDLNLPKDDTIAAMLPASIADAGVLRIATDASYAPNEFLKDGQGEPIGMDIDLGNAV